MDYTGAALDAQVNAAIRAAGSLPARSPRTPSPLDEDLSRLPPKTKPRAVAWEPTYSAADVGGVIFCEETNDFCGAKGAWFRSVIIEYDEVEGYKLQYDDKRCKLHGKQWCPVEGDLRNEIFVCVRRPDAPDPRPAVRRQPSLSQSQADDDDDEIDYSSACIRVGDEFQAEVGDSLLPEPAAMAADPRAGEVVWDPALWAQSRPAHEKPQEQEQGLRDYCAAAGTRLSTGGESGREGGNRSALAKTVSGVATETEALRLLHTSGYSTDSALAQLSSDQRLESDELGAWSVSDVSQFIAHLKKAKFRRLGRPAELRKAADALKKPIGEVVGWYFFLRKHKDWRDEMAAASGDP